MCGKNHSHPKTHHDIPEYSPTWLTIQHQTQGRRAHCLYKTWYYFVFVCVHVCVYIERASALIFSQLGGQKFILLLSDVGQLLARFFQLSLLPQHLLLSCNDLQARRNSHTASFCRSSINQTISTHSKEPRRAVYNTAVYFFVGYKTSYWKLLEFHHVKCFQCILFPALTYKAQTIKRTWIWIMHVCMLCVILYICPYLILQIFFVVWAAPSGTHFLLLLRWSVSCLAAWGGL